MVRKPINSLIFEWAIILLTQCLFNDYWIFDTFMGLNRQNGVREIYL